MADTAFPRMCDPVDNQQEQRNEHIISAQQQTADQHGDDQAAGSFSLPGAALGVSALSVELADVPHSSRCSPTACSPARRERIIVYRPAGSSKKLFFSCSAWNRSAT